MTEHNLTFEICDNAEWLTVYGGFIERDGDDLDREAAASFVSRLESEIQRRLPEAVCVSPGGQRKLCHGWNGAGFTTKLGPVGSWGTLTAEQVQAIENAIEAARPGVK